MTSARVAEVLTMQLLEALLPKARKLAKQGRPRKQGAARYDNGRLIKPPKEETIAQRQAVVLMQPHRRDATDPHGSWRSSLVGRLVDSGKVRAKGSANYPALESDRRTLLKAADIYARAWSDMRRVMDSRRPYANGEGRSRPDITDEERRRIERRWGDLSRCVRDEGGLVVKALEYAVLDSQPEDYDPPFWVLHGCAVGLAALARYEGIE